MVSNKTCSAYKVIKVPGMTRCKINISVTKLYHASIKVGLITWAHPGY